MYGVLSGQKYKPRISCQTDAKINGFLSFVNSVNEIAKIAMILRPGIKLPKDIITKFILFKHET